MKKVISLVLAIALFATLSIVAFADVVTHDETYCGTIYYEYVNQDGDTVVVHIPTYDVEYVKSVIRESSDHVDVTMPAGMEVRWTQHKEAITAAELAEFSGYKNLTVFYQRMVEKAVAGEMTVKLWDCSVANYQQVVVLALVDGAWIDLAPNSGDNTVTVVLPEGVESIVVCRAY